LRSGHNVPAIERKAGLLEALKGNPGVQLPDMQVANWQATEALQKTNAWLTQFRDNIGAPGVTRLHDAGRAPDDGAFIPRLFCGGPSIWKLYRVLR
jgi:hypothetical protein